MELLIIGCGLAGISAAIEGAKRGYGITLISPYPPERAQSVMKDYVSRKYLPSLKNYLGI